MNISKKKFLVKLIFFFLLSLTFLVATISYWQSHQVRRGEAQQEEARPSHSVKDQEKTEDAEAEAAPQLATLSQTQVNIKFKEVVAKIGAVVEDPTQEQQKLREFALSLNEQQLEGLVESVLKGEKKGDDRFMVAEVLIENASPTALRGLRELVLQLETKRPLDTPSSYDVMITQMRAIEGLAQSSSPDAKDHLRDILQKSDNAYLVKFARSQVESM